MRTLLLYLPVRGVWIFLIRRFIERLNGANLLERTFIAPSFVNYHLEPHLLFYVPWLHPILMSGPHAAHMEVQRGYLSVLRLATAKPDADVLLIDCTRDVCACAAMPTNQPSVGEW